MDENSIALCIPAYNAEKFLPALLDSALDQNPKFSEIIVCVDACSDKTEEIARSYNVIVIVNERNLGCSGSKNRALNRVSSNWVHFHDADDLLLDGFTDEARQWIIRDPRADVIIMGFEYVDYASRELITIGLQSDDELLQDPVRYAIRKKIPNFGLYRTSALRELGGFDEDPQILYNEDVAFHLKLATSGLRFRASDKITSRNYKHLGSMSVANELKCLRAHFEVMRRIADLTGGKYGEEISERLWHTATGLAVYNDWVEADLALDLAAKLSLGLPSGQSGVFQLLCRMIGAKKAFRVREILIRRLKPHLRDYVASTTS